MKRFMKHNVCLVQFLSQTWILRMTQICGMAQYFFFFLLNLYCLTDVVKVIISQEQWHDSNFFCCTLSTEGYIINCSHTWWISSFTFTSIVQQSTAHSRTKSNQHVNTHQLDNLTENPSGFVLDWETIPENEIRSRSFARSQVTNYIFLQSQRQTSAFIPESFTSFFFLSSLLDATSPLKTAHIFVWREWDQNDLWWNIV